MYSLSALDNKEIKRAKGVNKSGVGNIRHKEYVDVLFRKKQVKHNMKKIQSKPHQIGTYDISKNSLSCFDNKRYTLGDEAEMRVWLVLGI